MFCTIKEKFTSLRTIFIYKINLLFLRQEIVTEGEVNDKILDFYKKLKEGLLYNPEPDSWAILEDYTHLNKIINTFFFSDFNSLINYLHNRYPILDFADINTSLREYIIFLLSNDKDIQKYYKMTY